MSKMNTPSEEADKPNVCPGCDYYGVQSDCEDCEGSKTPNDTHPDTPKQIGEMERVLLAAYYRGKDRQGYSDTELKADVAALQALQDKKLAEAASCPNCYGKSHALAQLTNNSKGGK